jgi:hypothetical protein
VPAPPTPPGTRLTRPQTHLVQQQQVGLNKQRARQRDTHAPAAAKRARGPRHHGRVKRQPRQDGRRARLGAVRINLHQPPPHGLQPRRRRSFFRTGRRRGGIKASGSSAAGALWARLLL